MRQFVVLGFATTSNSEPGEFIHIGQDRGESLSLVNKDEPKFARKEMYELARPSKTRHKPTATVQAQKPEQPKQSKKKATAKA